MGFFILGSQKPGSIHICIIPIIVYLLQHARYHKNAQYLVSHLPCMMRLEYDDPSPTWPLEPCCPLSISVASLEIQAPWHYNFLPLLTVKKELRNCYSHYAYRDKSQF